jgi:hypothetical protein
VQVTEYFVESDHVVFIIDSLRLPTSSDALDTTKVSQVPLLWVTPYIGVRTFKLKRSLGAIKDDILLDRSNMGAHEVTCDIIMTWLGDEWTLCRVLDRNR